MLISRLAAGVSRVKSIYMVTSSNFASASDGRGTSCMYFSLIMQPFVFLTLLSSYPSVYLLLVVTVSCHVAQLEVKQHPFKEEETNR